MVDNALVAGPQVVVLSNLVPFDGIPHAGGQYMLRLVRALETMGEVTVIVPNTPAARTASTRAGAPRRLLIGGAAAPSVIDRGLRRMTAGLDRRWRQRDQGAPPLDLALALLRDSKVRAAVREADILDLQWSEMIRLSPVLRLLNPRARRVGTFHDVQSQLFLREVAAYPEERDYWEGQAARARRAERRSVRRLDATVAFGEKDLDLLGRPATGRVLRPPLSTGSEVPHAVPGGEPRALFVSHLARPENADAVRWLLSEIWPQVLEELPRARLRIAGAGAPEDLIRAVVEEDSVDLLGFVDDLAPEYAAARAVVVPLRFGAGVKFKTIDALLQGVPVVTTSVGAEGIGPETLYAAVADRSAELAAALVHALRETESVQPIADRAQAWAVSTFGDQGFRSAVADAYGLVNGRLLP